MYMKKNSEFNMFFKSVGLNIKKIRLQEGLTQFDLAKKAGIALISLNKIERGVYGAKLQTLFELSSALNVKPAELLADDSTVILNKERLSFLLNNDKKEC